VVLTIMKKVFFWIFIFFAAASVQFVMGSYLSQTAAQVHQGGYDGIEKIMVAVSYGQTNRWIRIIRPEVATGTPLTPGQSTRIAQFPTELNALKIPSRIAVDIPYVLREDTYNNNKIKRLVKIGNLTRSVEDYLRLTYPAIMLFNYTKVLKNTMNASWPQVLNPTDLEDADFIASGSVCVEISYDYSDERA